MMNLKWTRNRQAFLSFVRDSRQILEDLHSEVRDENVHLFRSDPQLHTTLFRLIHTLKGEASFFSMTSVESLCHKAEDLLSTQVNPSPQDYSVFRNTILQLEKEFNTSLEQGALHSKGLTKEFSNHFLKEPIGQHFQHFNDVCMDLGEHLGKKVLPIFFQNEDLLIFPENYRPLFHHFIHIFRNIMDHGIEPPELRRALGKSPEGKIQVKFDKTQDGGKTWLHIEVQDDGRGIDPKVLNRIFDPGFSTKTEVTPYSGRGIGLPTLREEAQRLGGEVQVQSQVSQGTKIRVIIPWLSGRGDPK